MLFRKIFAILRIVVINLSLIFLLIGIFLDLFGNQHYAEIFILISSILGTIGLILIILYFVFFTSQNLSYRQTPTYNVPKQKPVKTVDVKEVPKTKEEKLYEQYEGLYKKNLITKEDLDNKRKELLGK